MATKTFAIGSKVRLTGKFLRNTGQQLGGAGQSVWTVMGFSNGGRWVITNQPCDTSIYTADELASDPTLAFRRIAVANLQLVGKPDHSL